MMKLFMYDRNRRMALEIEQEIKYNDALHVRLQHDCLPQLLHRLKNNDNIS